ncbi:hypothetical protein [Legionella fairfieldensis]|uniref:hypothetical protein n=1 Tax=Legionella fairfieldensis TaxID=45064 RepID=UPI00048AF4FF|nr:hypothetical protein [Legionella fairfieldensis]
MLKRSLKYLIITLVQFIILALLVVVVVSQFLSSAEEAAAWQTFFKRYQLHFLGFHCLFYLVLFLAWPVLIHQFLTRRGIVLDAVRLKQAQHARYYGVGFLILLEVLFQWSAS